MRSSCRAFDLAGVAIATLSRIRPIALLIDDVQWADDDTLRLLRYVVRSDSDQPIFLFMTIRPDEFATVTEAVNFVADMERMGLVRRMRPGQFGSLETAELLKRVLAGPVEASSAAAMHAQSEGVPFIVEELARTHREAGTLQQVDGEWRLGRNAARLVPSAVRTLIDRRAARLPARTRAALGDAAILGRSFSLRDLRAIRARVGDGDISSDLAVGDRPTDPGQGADSLADDLEPAVAAGLLLQGPDGGAADYTFTHEQVRQFAANLLTAARRRRVHAAVVDLLLDGGDPAPAGLPMLAQHALAAGDTVRAAQFSIQAATAALGSNAPEEALRLIDQALPVISSPAERQTLLVTRDDAYAALRKTDERLDGLSELTALAEAMRDPVIELDVQLRRASALRMSHDEDAAAELAKRVRTRARELGDLATELRANLEIGQALLRAPLGKSYGGATPETDLDGAEEAFRRAIELAEQVRDDRALAAALREIGMIDFARGRAWFAGEVFAGRAGEVLSAVAAGADIETLLMQSEIGPLLIDAGQVLERALAIFERLNDRTGVMSTVIAMAYASYGPVMHLSSSARHLEEIRRVTSRLSAVVTESERDRLDLQMLFGVHVYSRAKVVPDLALSRGEDAHRAARLQGDRAIEFLAAGGVAMTLLELGDVDGAERWIGWPRTAAAMAPSRAARYSSRPGAAWSARGAGDAEGMRGISSGGHDGDGERTGVGALRGPGPPRHRSGVAPRGVDAAAERAPDSALVELVERSAAQVKELLPLLPGHAPWGAQADAALATVALVRGDLQARPWPAALPSRHSRPGSTRTPAWRSSSPRPGPSWPGPARGAGPVRGLPPGTLSRIAQGTADEKIRVRWLTGPVGRELVELAGPMDGTVDRYPEPGAGRRRAGDVTSTSAGCCSS